MRVILDGSYTLGLALILSKYLGPGIFKLSRFRLYSAGYHSQFTAYVRTKMGDGS